MTYGKYVLLSDKIYPTQQLFLLLQGCEKHKGLVQPIFWLLQQTFYGFSGDICTF